MKLKNIIFVILFILTGFFIDKKLNKTEDKAEVSLKFQERVEQVMETDINKAEPEDFLRFNVSLKKAEKIIKFRETLGCIEDISELERIKGFGKKTVEDIAENFIVMENNLQRKRLEINNASDELLLWYGFGKKEIKKIRKYITENNRINSNLDLRKILSEKRYVEYKKLIIYTKYN